MTDAQLTFIHLSDTHLHPDPAFKGEMSPYSPLEGTKAVVEAIKALPFKVDFILHTGDVMNDPETHTDYQIVRDLLNQLNLPVYYLPGNHDKPEGIRQVLGVFPRSYYDFEVNGIQIIALDSKMTDSHAGYIAPDQLTWLENLCTASDDRPLIVALHHHTIPLYVPWLDEMILTNGDAVHQILLKAKHRLRCVLFGHIHEQVCLIRDGITYISAQSIAGQINTWNGQTDLIADKVQMPGFNLVTLAGQDTLVRTYRVPVKSEQIM
jgi:Icc protein